MRTDIQNQLNMIAAVIVVLDAPASKTVWENQSPTAFTKKVRDLRKAHAAALLLGQRQTQPTTGAADDKSLIETLLEDLIIEEMGLLNSYYEDFGETADLAKVSLSPSRVRTLPNQELLSLGNNIADLAEPLTEGSPSPGAEYEITPETVARLRAAAESFEAHLGQPAGARATRKQLTHDLRVAVDALVKALENMDNLIPRFRRYPDGEAFIGAWGNARQVVALGHRFEKKPGPEAVATAAVPPADSPGV
ncbi:MAG: hypothetical protein V4726_08620 [Verrucomicrobiota bacterium]